MADIEARAYPSSRPLSERLLSVLCRKWSAAVLIQLSDGARGFAELLRSVRGVKRGVLAGELARLVREGLVRREELPVRPRQVSYSLTPAGTAFLELLGELSRWEERIFPVGRTGQQRGVTRT